MNRKRKILLYIVGICIVIGIIIIKLWTPNYNRTYSYIIDEMKAVPNGEYITEIDISYPVVTTDIDIAVNGESLTTDELWVLSEDLKKVIDDNIYNDMIQPGNEQINPLAVNFCIITEPFELDFRYLFERTYDVETDTYNWDTPEKI